ncbi:MAG: NYN domain-containing protein [Desulfobacterales bacterium]|nr:NYN domain-containing protein [Desulfobacterales bacterium]
MPLHIIIDGYNLIRQSHSLSSLDRKDIQHGRRALLDMLAAYKKLRPHRITVVFDGISDSAFSSEKEKIKGIEVRFSRRSDSADTVIKELASGYREKALIVSSDMDVVRFAEAKGAATISSPLFENKIRAASYFDGAGTEDEEEEAERRTDTKKKGPGRRLSKKIRLNIARAGML